MLSSSRSRSMPVLFGIIAMLLLGNLAYGIESPTSAGPVSLIDEPIIRIPKASRPPTIDGIMEEGEWEDATAFSNFWYDRFQSDYRYMAPIETQLQVYMMYDDEHLYVAYSSPVYPESSWLKARGRFPNVLFHPRYGVLWDDHIELELRPYHDHVRGFQLGLFKWVANPIDVIVDYYLSGHTGEQFNWDSKATIRSHVTATRWTTEIKIPFTSMVYNFYDGADRNNQPIVQLPPADGTVYRCWFARAIGGVGPFFNCFDGHMWNTTKTMLIFDSRTVGFQVNELGPIMENIVDMTITVKNHDTRSQAMRLGFFVENADGLIYSSYEDDTLVEGILELIPGEVRRLRLRHPFPGITDTGNTLWFDVRTAGRPAKTLFRTRLVDFHAHDVPGFREKFIDTIETFRPPRTDFDIDFDMCPYNKRLVVSIDRGIHGASDAAQMAVEARVALVDEASGKEYVSQIVPINGAFAIADMEVPELPKSRSKRFTDMHWLRVNVILFDQDQRIVAEERTRAFDWRGKLPMGMGSSFYDWYPEAERHEGQAFTPAKEWMHNEVGTGDIVWEPFEPIKVMPNGFEVLNHIFTLGASGLPEQIFIKPEPYAVRLELRQPGANVADSDLVEVGRGPQLRAPMRLEAVVGGVRHTAQVVQPARLVRQWESEVEYHSTVRVGPIQAQLQVQYDCDGSMHAKLVYGTGGPVEIESFELISDFRGLVDLLGSGMHYGGRMTGADISEAALPPYEGVVWESSSIDPQAMFYSHFVPWIYFGSGDRGFSWYADSDQGWRLDKHGSAMKLERNADGEITWRVLFVNHKNTLSGQHTIEFSILTHPSKPKPADHRMISWNYRGDEWAIGYMKEIVDLTEDYLKADWTRAAKAPRNTPWEESKNWVNELPIQRRYGRWRQITISAELDRIFEDRGAYLLGRQISVGRRQGWWWDESWPAGFSQSNNIAGGYAYVRDPESVGENELPWHSGWTTTHMRNLHKRLAKVFKTENIPQRQYHWANASANLYESLSWDSVLMEACGSDHMGHYLDLITMTPMSLYRLMTNNYLGVISHITPRDVTTDRNTTMTRPGDDKRLDRQYFGLGLLHDIGVKPFGPHGRICHPEQALRLQKILYDFGYFDLEQTEHIPYWRNQHLVQWGAGRKRHAPRIQLDTHEPHEQLYVAVYRRPFEKDGRRGYKALILVLNGFREEVTADLTLLDVERILGGPNTLRRSDVLGNYGEEFEGVAGLLAEWNGGDDVPVLLDIEHGTFVELGSRQGNSEVYRSVHVPYHNYRLFYAHYLAE